MEVANPHTQYEYRVYEVIIEYSCMFFLPGMFMAVAWLLPIKTAAATKAARNMQIKRCIFFGS